METRTPGIAAPPSHGARMRTDTKPWYRQFWPWFLIALPASSVVAGLATLAIAIRNADEVVSKPGYELSRFAEELPAAGDGEASAPVPADSAAPPPERAGP